MSNNNSWARCTGDSYTLCPSMSAWHIRSPDFWNQKCSVLLHIQSTLDKNTLASWPLYSLHTIHSTLHFKPTAQNKSKSLRFFMSFSMVPGVHHQCLLQKLSKAFWSALSKELVKKLNIFFGERAYMTEYSPICLTPLLQLPSWHIAVFILSYA